MQTYQSDFHIISGWTFFTISVVVSLSPFITSVHYLHTSGKGTAVTPTYGVVQFYLTARMEVLQI